MKSNGRKWFLVKMRLLIDTLVIGAAIWIALKTKNEQPATTFLLAAFADLTANYATYFASNVVQKNIISKHYIKDLHETESAK